jgi:hypothetical protein
MELGAGRFDPKILAQLTPDVEIGDLETVSSER